MTMRRLLRRNDPGPGLPGAPARVEVALPEGRRRPPKGLWLLLQITTIRFPRRNDPGQDLPDVQAKAEAALLGGPRLPRVPSRMKKLTEAKRLPSKSRSRSIRRAKTPKGAISNEEADGSKK